MRVKYTIRTRILALVCAALAVIVTPALLFAHAHLVRSTPAAKASLAAPPTSLTLWFSESPELKFTALKLLDSAGREMPLGAVSALPGDKAAITAPITGTLPGGRYTVVWNTAAADGHASKGQYTFVVASSQQSAVLPAPPTSAESAVATPHAKTNAVVTPSAVADFPVPLRWAELVAILVLIGTVVFRLVVLPDAGLPPHVLAEGDDRVRRLAQSALLLFVIATLTRVVAESNLIPNASNARMRAVMTVVESTRWGHGWLIGLCGAAVVLVGLLLARGSRVGWIVAGLGAVAIATSEGATGHAAAALHYLPLSIAVDLAHFLGGGGWLGGLTALLVCGLPSLRSLDETERQRAGSRLVRSYHRAALECVAIVLVTALIASWLRLTSVSDLWTTSYGAILFKKIMAVIAVLGFGLYHQSMAVRPDWGSDTKSRFQRSATAELFFGALVVAATAFLVGTSLPGQ
jgi:putative copper export protein/methionine-rich copper-binding protein CopC